jgi:hypothetical protein
MVLFQKDIFLKTMSVQAVFIQLLVQLHAKPREKEVEKVNAFVMHHSPRECPKGTPLPMNLLEGTFLLTRPRGCKDSEASGLSELCHGRSS